MNILAIESSCDETAAAVVKDGRMLLSSVVASQMALHARYGGVVPEVASRAHIEAISNVVGEALKQANIGTVADGIDAVAVTYAPGLIGSLLVGVNFAKALAFSWRKTLIPVHHIRGHIAANYLCTPGLKPPFVAFVASGGHTSIIDVTGYTEMKTIGRTRDDAAGEAFDKIGRVMGLPYPGGAEADRLAAQYKKEKNVHDPLPVFPLAEVKTSPLDFSFSGLKTAVINFIHNARQKNADINVPQVCAALTDNICHSIVQRLSAALDLTGYAQLAVSGGVMANSHIRGAVEELCVRKGVAYFAPPISLCGDNAAMIAAQAHHEYQNGHIADFSLNACATCEV